MHHHFIQPQEQVLINRQDIINRKDAWDKQEFVRMSIQYMLQHPAFHILLALLLVTNAITIALRTNSFLDQKHYEFFSVIDDIVLTTLICEVLLRWLSGFWIFWKDGWNVLNFFIVCMLVLGVLDVVNVSITYCLRVLRLVHVCMAVEPLARIIRVILQAGPGMAQIGVLILFVMLVFALLGVTLFGESVPIHFGNLGVALYTLFVCLTQDGWVDIYGDFRMKERDYALEIGGAIYFAIFIIIGGIIGMNLLVTVVTRNLEQITKTEELEQQHQKNFSETGAEKEDWSHELPLPHCTLACMEKPDLHQETLVGSPMSNLSENMLHNFCLVLEEIEENLTQYKKIREELDNIVQEVRSIPFNQEQIEELMRRPFSMSLMESGSSMDLQNIAKQQDLFSALVSRAKVHLPSPTQLTLAPVSNLAPGPPVKVTVCSKICLAPQLLPAGVRSHPSLLREV
ncbi:cation channel sperm-associated protein 4 isoform X1 [Fukomys damarensis]|uniref:cation channel sperm-associated protein 4 isoform X1 n=2 Tax=Fukomys damarensis TaxID=885580 RepID=UPI00054030BE|nr:cation channel sperm-associated protein 4 isoform X1 [Fukomys damarensis]XP_010629365.1 cation channel sperm-associated protein 4 isoform X1 [Fukomys damarensis]